MKKIILTIAMTILTTSAFARINCIDQAEQVAQAVYDLNLKDGFIHKLNKIVDKGNFSYEFIFVEGQCDGTKISIKMEPQEDPENPCSLKSLIRKDLRFTKVPACN